MPEGDGPKPPELPEPENNEEFVRGIERELGFDPDAEPVWGYLPPKEKVFTEEADMLEARRLAHDCLFELRIQMSSAVPDREPLNLTPEDIQRAYQEYKQELASLWLEDHAEPFPDFSLTNLLGAAKRQIAWLTEVKQFRETDEFDQPLEIYTRIQNLLEQAL
jgi:hypothetical protein